MKSKEKLFAHIITIDSAYTRWRNYSPDDRTEDRMWILKSMDAKQVLVVGYRTIQSIHVIFRYDDAPTYRILGTTRVLLVVENKNTKPFYAPIPLDEEEPSAISVVTKS
jgi:hypothetical protein